MLKMRFASGVLSESIYQLKIYLAAICRIADMPTAEYKYFARRHLMRRRPQSIKLLALIAISHRQPAHYGRPASIRLLSLEISMPAPINTKSCEERVT